MNSKPTASPIVTIQETAPVMTGSLVKPAPTVAVTDPFDQLFATTFAVLFVCTLLTLVAIWLVRSAEKGRKRKSRSSSTGLTAADFADFSDCFNLGSSCDCGDSSSAD
jgi:hypothetical protein